MSTTTDNFNCVDLPEADIALLDKALRADFNLESLVSDAPGAHPAQRALVHLVAWLSRGEIRRAAKAAVEALEEAATYTRALYKARQGPILQKMLETAAALLPDKVELPADPAAAVSAAKRILLNLRETRLVFSAIFRFTAKPRQTRAKSINDSPPIPSTDTDLPVSNIALSHPDLSAAIASPPLELAHLDPAIAQFHTALAGASSS